MFSKIWLVNLILAVCVAFLGLQSYRVWTEGHGSETRPEPVEIKDGKTDKPVVGGVVRPRLPPERAFDTVVNRNLFSPDRTESEGAKEDGKADNQVSDKDAENALKGITLYGVIVTDAYQGALVTEKALKRPILKGKPSRKPVRQEESRWVKVGDVLGDFKVASIAPDRISLSTGTGSYDLFLHDKEKPRDRAAVKASSGSPVVVQAGTQAPGGTPGTGSAAAARGGTQAPAARPSSGVNKAAQSPSQPVSARKPFQSAEAPQKQTTATSPPTTGNVGAQSANPFERALRQRGILPNK